MAKKEITRFHELKKSQTNIEHFDSFVEERTNLRKKEKTVKINHVTSAIENIYKDKESWLI